MSESIGQVINNKGYIVEADDLVYVSVKLLASSSYYQALGLVSKGLAGLGKTFRVGTFQNESSEVDMGNSGNNFNFLNFVSVLATQDNTVVNFSDFGNGATIFNDANYENIILNRGESYIIGVQPSVLNVDNTNALIGVLVESNKPIAVNSGSFNGTNADYSSSQSGQDAGIDQLAPLERVGSEYIFVRGVGPSEVERPLIVAHEPNTEIYVNGVLEFTIAQAGGHYSIPSEKYGVDYPYWSGTGPTLNESSNMHVTTSKPA